jgi:error-prone DNA polymerase
VKEAFGTHCSLAVNRALDSLDDPGFSARRALARRAEVPLVATSDVVMHARIRKRLQDVLTCIRLKCTIDQVGRFLDTNAERILHPPAEMTARFAAAPGALARTLEIA